LLDHAEPRRALEIGGRERPVRDREELGLGQPGPRLGGVVRLEEEQPERGRRLLADPGVARFQ
jgi:hypothetical protein